VPEIVLATFNARYTHTAFGLRYLLANLGDLQPRATLLEFDIGQRPLDVAEQILAAQPRILGLGVHIWNVDPSRQLVALLKRLRPELIVVLGGPEVSYETADQEICRLADHVIAGEADLEFADLCRQLLVPAGAVVPQLVAAPLPDLAQVALPYDLYTDDDLAHRLIYVEASRGCPFACEFCLSSLDLPVRRFPLDKFLNALQQLLDRGARGFKFVDRTFNLDLQTSAAILQFFRDRDRPGLALHFEMIPDRFPAALRALVAQFPPRQLQFEVGIQTFNEEVAARISRRQDNTQAAANLRWLRDQTGVQIHADLIFGLPGETIESLAAGFDRLVGLRPHVIQVGILKRLRGTPIDRHTAEWQMVYRPEPPYEILQNRLVDFPAMQRLKRFARYWDIVANRGRFQATLPLLWSQTPPGQATASPFAGFLRFSDWLFAATHQTHAIALPRLARLLGRYLVEVQGLRPDAVRETLAQDQNESA